MVAVTCDRQFLERSRWHRRRARETRADTSTLIARALQLRQVRTISGASDLDTSTIVALLANVSLCIDCIAKKTGVPRDEAKTLLSRIQTSIIVTGESARCEACLALTTVFRLGGPAR